MPNARTIRLVFRMSIATSIAPPFTQGDVHDTSKTEIANRPFQDNRTTTRSDHDPAILDFAPAPPNPTLTGCRRRAKRTSTTPRPST